MMSNVTGLRRGSVRLTTLLSLGFFLLYALPLVGEAFAPVAARATRLLPRATFTVSNLADSGPGSLRQAIIDASEDSDADLIVFTVTGTITLTSGQLPTMFGGLTISGPGADDLTISGNSSSGVFVMDGADLTISGLTVSNANAFGGAINGRFGTMTIADCTFSANSPTSYSGAVISSVFTNCTITNCTFSDNSALSGGVIVDSGGNYDVTNCTFSGNSAAGTGGVVNSRNGLFRFTNCTFSGNSAAGAGGVFHFESGGLRLAHCTLVDNSASADGAVRLVLATGFVKNSIFANNTPSTCSSGTVESRGVNYSTDASCGFTVVTPDQLRLGPLADNGGPTMTHALLPGSIAIDAATDCTDVFGQTIATDQRGVSRPIDGNGDVLAVCDAGSYEATSALCYVDDVSGDRFQIVVDTSSPSYGVWVYTVASTGQTFSGTADYISYAPRRSLSAYDRNDPNYQMQVTASYATNVATVTLTVRATGRRYVIRDRNIRNNVCS